MLENKFYLTKEGVEKIEKEYQKLLEFKKLKSKSKKLLHDFLFK